MENKNVAKIIADVLREHIKSRGINQKWVADKAGTTEPTISRYLKGTNKPDIGIMIRVAKALNVSVDYLCGLTTLATPSESLSAEILVLLRCYDRADVRDKKTIWTVLERYMTEAEKEGGFMTSMS